MASSSRIGITLLLTLLVPAILTAAWAWLMHGGVVDGARDNERAARTQCRDTAERLVYEALDDAARRAMFPLELDEERRVVGPFCGPADGGDGEDQAPITLAEAAANARLAAGQQQAALPFFAHAHAAGELSAEGTLAYASQLAPRAPGEALALLDGAEQRFADTWCGPLPFALLACLERMRLGGDEDELARTFLEQAQRVAPGSIPALVPGLLAARPTLAEDPRLIELRVAAETARELGAMVVPTTVEGTSDGPLLVPRADGALAVIPAASAHALLRGVAERTEALHPGHRVTIDGLDRAAWRVEPIATPVSTILTATARTCLGLAIATLVLGNLLLWRLTRRELALVRMRRDFVDVVSHELRTPLTALSLKAEMLALGDVPADRMPHYLQTLRGDVHRLTDQVERILDFGRLERGAPLQRERVPARAVLARGLREGRPALRLVGQHIELDAPRTLPNLEVDVEVLARALRNLLENAAKYTPMGSTVDVRAFAEGPRVIIEVADAGPGVAADERTAIFQPFVRASAAERGAAGSGLGLALVAAAAKAHGGSVDVRERRGGGAVFTLTLPAARTQPESTPKADVS